MLEKINEKVSVVSVFSRQKNKSVPIRIKWQGRMYVVTKLGFHHSERLGRVLHHIFSVIADNMFFRLNFDTEDLSWTLEEVSDGLTA